MYMHEQCLIIYYNGVIDVHVHILCVATPNFVGAWLMAMLWQLFDYVMESVTDQNHRM